MNICKEGEPSSNENIIGRTGIQAGDRVTLYFPEGDILLFSVSRFSIKEQLVFEHGPDNKHPIDVFRGKNEAPAFIGRNFIFLLCLITGLQAKLETFSNNTATYEMQVGAEIFAD